MNYLRHYACHGTRRGARRGMALGVCAAASLILASGAMPAAHGRTAAQASATPAERGKYLVTIGGCNDCHTTKKMTDAGPQPDTTKLLAGHPETMKLPSPPKLAANGPWNVVTTPTLTAWSGPWGVSFAVNLTPDPETGLGHWTEEMFVKAMRTGKHMGASRPILPPMPWQEIAAMSDADLKAVYAYLRTIPPVVNHVPSPIPPSSTAGSK